jgi:RNA polymerase sigma factor (sigma-70 family)
MEKMDNKDLEKVVAKAKKNDSAALEQLYSSSHDMAYFTAVSIVKNEQDALDVVQDSYITAFSKLDTLKDNALFIGWLKTIVANNCKNLLKRKNPMLFSSEEEEANTLENIEEQSEDFLPASYIEQSVKREKVMDIINELSDVQKATILFHYYDELSIKEIAQAMDCTESTVTSRISYAKKHIKTEVEKLEKKGDKLYAMTPMPFLRKLFIEESKNHIMPEAVAKTVFTKAMVASGVTGAGSVGGTAVTGLVTKFAALSIGGKCTVAGIMATVIVGGSVAGIAVKNNADRQELANLINSEKTVTIEVAKPSAYTIAVKGQQQGDVNWIQLDQLKTYATFRQEFDKEFNINVITMNNVNGKSGCMYVDKTGDRNGNTTLNDAFRNKVFIEKYWNNSDVKNAILKLANDAYTDVDNNDSYELTGAINAYYNLLNDAAAPDSFNATQSVTREQFYTLMYKSSTPVGTDYLTNYNGASDEFTKAVGGKETAYTPFAKQEAQYGFLDYKNGSLNGTNISSSITRAEAVYSVIMANFKAEYDKFNINTNSGFKDVKNGGNIAESGQGKKEWQLYTLAYMMDHQDKGMQEELYKAIALANQLGIVTPDDNGDLRWDEPISKSESIQLIIDTQLALDKTKGYLSTVEYGNNNVSKFTIMTGLIVDPAQEILVNPQTNPDTGEKTGVTADGRQVSVLPKETSSSSSSSTSSMSAKEKEIREGAAADGFSQSEIDKQIARLKSEGDLPSDNSTKSKPSKSTSKPSKSSSGHKTTADTTGDQGTGIVGDLGIGVCRPVIESPVTGDATGAGASPGTALH